MRGLAQRPTRVAVMLLALAWCAPAGAQSDAGVAPEAAPPANQDESTGRSAREVDALLGGLTDGSGAERRAAADAIIAALEREDIPAVRQKLLAPIRSDIDQMRIRIVRAVNVATQGRDNVEYDLLTALTNAPRSPDVDVAVERITLARALARMQSADAGRALVLFAASFNGAFRLEVGRLIRSGLRSYALPGMIELRNPSEPMRVFLRQTREALRKVTPGEAVQERDNALLAEIIRAYGSIRAPDAMRVVVSFVNNDRTQVRDAARWALAQYGREAINAIRDAYEMYEGHDADPAWGWERVARELYSAYDRRREAEVVQRLDAGLAAGRAGQYEPMMEHFRFVLSRHPDIARRAEMVEPIMAYARSLERSDAARAQSEWRKALWLAPDGPHAREIQAQILYIEAERSLERGVADPELYRAVLRVDPQHAAALSQLESVTQDAFLRRRRWRARLGIAGLLAVAVGLIWALARNARSPRRRRAPAEPVGGAAGG